jgi:hypothetical protein
MLLYVDRTHDARSGRLGAGSQVARSEGSAADEEDRLAVEPPSGPEESSAVHEPRPEEASDLPAGVLSIVVRAAQGSAIPGVTVTLVERDRRGAPTGVPQVRTTDKNGEVVFSGLPPAAYRLAFSHQDYAPLVTIAGIRADRGTHLAVTLESGAELDVKVTGPRSEPVARQEIVVTQQEEPPRRARTGVEGLAVFQHLKTTHGCYVEMVGVPGGAMVEVTLPKSGTRAVEFRVGSQLIGSVVGPEGSPVAGVSVEASRSGQYHRADTDPCGRYRIDGLAPGPASIRVRQPGEGGFQTPGLPLVILEGTTEHDIHIGRGEIAGVVTHGGTGTPLPHTSIYLHRVVPPPALPGEGGVDLWLYTGLDGRFSARGLPAGRYRLYCNCLAGFREKQVFLDLAEAAADDDVEIVLEPKRFGTLTLRVITADGRPPKELSVGVTDATSNLFTSLRPTQRGEGVYELELDAGEHSIRVYTDSTLRARFDVEIGEGRTTERVVDMR